MLRKSLFILIISTFCSSQGWAQKAKAKAAVQEILQIQQEAWNRGDIPGFMAHYWNDPGLKFVGSSGVNQGWQATFERYQKAYPDRAAMGKLRFDIISIDHVAKKTISLTGKFTLTRNQGDLSGYFLLIWQKKKGKWVIVADATA